VFVSSETLATKRSGALFRIFSRRDGSLPGQILHIGDNLFSDVLNARRAGYKTAPYIYGKPNRYERTLGLSTRNDGIVGSIIAGSARATRLSRTFGDQRLETIWNVSCGVTGPLLFSFVTWVLREAMLRNVKRLYFLSRDGEILLKVARILLPETSPLELRYLYVSRASLHPAAVEQLSSEDMRSLRVRAGDTLGSLLDKLNLTDVRLPDAEILSLSGLSRGTTLDQKLINDLCRGDKYKRLHDRITERAAALRLVVRRYLAQEGLLGQDQVGIVDIGWSGRLQRSIAKACAGVNSFRCDQLSGFYFGLVDTPADSGTFLSFSELPEGRTLKRVVREDLFEAFCAAHHGTVTGYAGDAIPTLLTPQNREASEWGLDVQQQGIVDFAKTAAKTFQLGSIAPLEHVPDLLDGVSTALQMFIQKPSRWEAVTFGDFLHSESSLHQSFATIAPPVRIRVRSIIRRLKGEEEVAVISRWPEGSITRSFPRFVSAALLAMLRAGQALRRKRPG
jgi:hypothetical protein